MKTGKKIGILGIGNLLLEDEGFGVHTVQYLMDNYIFPDQVELQDAGTAGIYMSPFLEECDPVFVVDVVDIEGTPGSFHHFTLEEVKAGKFTTRMSPHQLGMLEIMEVCKLRDAAPEQVEFFTIIPHSLKETINLSPAAAARMMEVVEIILQRLEKMGIKVAKKNETCRK
ncbi:MAG: hydrogenase maturation endopeptidase [Deltaproteobacteria bacterium]|nr:MAG: hydrogenase maturation endopeptidase [Deltaproteobacteria bacterium]